MTLDSIVQHRLVNQQLMGTAITSPKEMVAYFGAMQAQDYAMAKWAIGLRIGLNENTIEQAINSTEIIRTHILRPTWHFVSADDIRWMLMLTAPQVKQKNASMCKKYELDSTILNRCKTIIEHILSGNKELSREQIMLELNQHGIQTDDIRSVLIMMDAELDGIVCNGAMQGKQFTYALIDEKVPATKTFSKEEALATLAKKYFQSHSPATLQDFTWWSGLTAGNAKIALALIQPTLHPVKINHQTYWFGETLTNHNHHKEASSYHLIPAFDEFLISYKDRSASLSPSFNKEIITNNGIFKPALLINGKVEGSWKRNFKKDKVQIELQFCHANLPKQEILKASTNYGNFVGMEAIIQV